MTIWTKILSGVTQKILKTVFSCDENNKHQRFRDDFAKNSGAIEFKQENVRQEKLKVNAEELKRIFSGNDSSKEMTK